MRFTALLLILSIFMFSCSQSVKDSNNTAQIPTKSIEDSFKSDYPDAKDVSWEEEGEYMEVEFELKGNEISLLYDKDGKVLEKELEIEPEDLPVTIAIYIAENYDNAEIEEAEKILKDNKVFFEVEIENEDEDEMELLFDFDGNFLQEVVETDEEGEEEEENEIED